MSDDPLASEQEIEEFEQEVTEATEKDAFCIPLLPQLPPVKSWICSH